MNSRIFICLLMLMGLTGCMTNHHQRSVSSNLVGYLYPNGSPSSHQADQMPLLKLPLRVGVAFIPESSFDSRFSLSASEKHKLLTKVADRFKKDKSVNSIHIIPEIYLRQGKGFTTIEQVAALHNVDVMALVSYDQVSVHELRQSSLAYWTIVGAYLVKGESTEFQTFVDTAVFDVRTRKLLFRAPGSHTDSRNHTAVGYEKGNRLMKLNSFHSASEKMTDNLHAELLSFKKRVKQGKEVRVKYDRKHYGSGSGTLGWGALVGLILLVRFARIKD